MTTLHDFTQTTLDGKPKKLADYKGKAALIVNVASKCGLTPQYAGLEKLHETYGARGLEVLGFPCNQFGGQEPGSEAEIANFCTTNYGVKFPMFAKLEVNGAGRAPLYAWLTAEKTAPDGPGDVALELRQVPGRQGRQGDRALQPARRARRARARRRDREGARLKRGSAREPLADPLAARRREPERAQRLEVRGRSRRGRCACRRFRSAPTPAASPGRRPRTRRPTRAALPRISISFWSVCAPSAAFTSTPSSTSASR